MTKSIGRYFCIIVSLICQYVVSSDVDSENKDLETVLNELGLTKYLQLLKTANLHELLHPRERRTLFVPSNEAFEKFELLFSERPLLNGKSLSDFLTYHSTNNVWLSKSWQNEQLLPTSLSGNNLRINIYDQLKNDTKIYTVNGVPITNFDNLALNGVVHVLDGIIYPAPPLNAYDTLRAYKEETEHFFEHIIASKLLQKLKYDEPTTVFVPVDIAFKKLPHTFMENFIGEAPVVAAVVYYHIVNGTYHLPGLNNKMRLRTLEGSALAVEHAGAGEKHLITVNKEAKILRSYPTKNGVVHMVDTVLFPPANPKQMMYAHKEHQILPPIRRR